MYIKHICDMRAKVNLSTLFQKYQEANHAAVLNEHIKREAPVLHQNTVDALET